MNMALRVNPDIQLSSVFVFYFPEHGHLKTKLFRFPFIQQTDHGNYILFTSLGINVLPASRHCGLVTARWSDIRMRPRKASNEILGVFRLPVIFVELSAEKVNQLPWCKT